MDILKCHIEYYCLNSKDDEKLGRDVGVSVEMFTCEETLNKDLVRIIREGKRAGQLLWPSRADRLAISVEHCKNSNGVIFSQLGIKRKGSKSNGNS